MTGRGSEGWCSMGACRGKDRREKTEGGRAESRHLHWLLRCYGGGSGYSSGGILHKARLGCQLVWKLIESFACHYQIGWEK